MYYTWLVKDYIINRFYMEVTEGAYLNRAKTKNALPFEATTQCI